MASESSLSPREISKVTDMRDNIKMESTMVRESTIGTLATFTKGNGKIIKSTEGESTMKKTEEDCRDSSNAVSHTEKL